MSLAKLIFPDIYRKLHIPDFAVIQGEVLKFCYVTSYHLINKIKTYRSMIE